MASFEVRIHPLAVASILDHHARRKAQQQGTRVIGALLGTVTQAAGQSSAVVDVTDTFPVPHAEGAKDVSVDFELQATMRELRRRSGGPREAMVGWYATGGGGGGVAASSALVHDFYRRELGADPVHVLVDPASGAVRAYAAAQPFRPRARALGCYFVPVRCAFAAGEMERIGVAALARAGGACGALPLADANAADAAQDALLALLDAAIAYVRGVATGARAGDAEVGRAVAAVAQQLPVLAPAELDRLTTESLQDVLMVAYVANLMRAQLALADRLRSALATAFPAPRP